MPASEVITNGVLVVSSEGQLGAAQGWRAMRNSPLGPSHLLASEGHSTPPQSGDVLGEASHPSGQPRSRPSCAQHVTHLGLGLLRLLRTPYLPPFATRATYSESWEWGLLQKTLACQAQALGRFYLDPAPHIASFLPPVSGPVQAL